MNKLKIPLIQINEDFQSINKHFEEMNMIIIENDLSEESNSKF